MEMASKLSKLRQLMTVNNVKAYIIPTSDAHNSEYVSDHDQRRAFISDFTGSAGTAVVTMNEAKLWTDGRYFNQALKELDSSIGWELMKDRLPTTPAIEQWLKDNFSSGDSVALDPFLSTYSTVCLYRDVLGEKKISLITTLEKNLVDDVWGDDQPPPSSSEIFVHDLKNCGISHLEKISSVRKEMQKLGLDGLVVSALDEVAWLLNLRGNDVSYNPVFYAYVVITANDVVFCVDSSRFSKNVLSHLGPDIHLRPYDSIVDVVSELPGRVQIDTNSANYAIWQALDSRARGSDPEPSISVKPSPLQLMKAIKNSVEVVGMRMAFCREAVAMCEFLSWLDPVIKTGKCPDTGESIQLTEFTAAEKLESFRALTASYSDAFEGPAPFDFVYREPGQFSSSPVLGSSAPLDITPELKEKNEDTSTDTSPAEDSKEQTVYLGPSFPSIAGSGPNGAVIHYRPEEHTARALSTSEMFLLDSGCHYAGGTTDTTRTMHWGTPSMKEINSYTAVLKAHIAGASLIFPGGTCGVAVDGVVRAPMWALGLDYGHGTGHGVGCFLNVHEGPQGVGMRARPNYSKGLLEGMTMTIEPGYYVDGEFGIRIENVYIVERASIKNALSGEHLLKFVPLTSIPIAMNLVNFDMITDKERDWINQYHKWVKENVPVKSDRAKEWLNNATKEI